MRRTAHVARSSTVIGGSGAALIGARLAGCARAGHAIATDRTIPAPGQRADTIFLAVALLGMAILTRASVLADWAYFNDESFYFLAAQKMHHGAWLYADVWDRKGPALFATYWLATLFSPTIVAVRVLALVCAAGTAMVLARIGARWAGMWGGALAGTLYLATLPMFVGAGAQPQVFQNLFIALAALLTLQSDERDSAARLWLAMLLAGMALTYKQTAICEGLGFGVWALARRWQRGAGAAMLCRLAVVMGLAGAAPFVVAGLIFSGSGHFGPFWHAMVTANLVKTYDPFGDHWTRIHALAIAASPVLALGAAGLARGALRDGAVRPGRSFVAVWLLAAAMGLMLIPNFYADYMLPLMAPLSIAGGMAMARRPLGPLAAGVVILIYLLSTSALDFAHRRAANAGIVTLAQTIAAHQPGARLLVYEGPLALYAMDNLKAPPSPLLDNFHLWFPYENNTSPRDTASEMRRILAWQPHVVVLYHNYPPALENPRTGPLVRAYAARCHLWGHAPYHEVAADLTLDVYGDCRD